MAYGVAVGSQLDIATHYQTTFNTARLSDAVEQALLQNEDPDQARNAFIRGQWGNPLFADGPSATMHNAFDANALRGAIDADELAIIGSQIHWYVIYVYETDADDQVVRLLVWDAYDYGQGASARTIDVEDLGGELFTFSSD